MSSTNPVASGPASGGSGGQRRISGYVITELNDVQWESNGLMDVRNHPRAFAERLAELQRPWLIIAKTPHTVVRAGERFEVSVRLAGAVEPPEGAQLNWRFANESGEAALGAEHVNRFRKVQKPNRPRSQPPPL